MRSLTHRLEEDERRELHRASARKHSRAQPLARAANAIDSFLISLHCISTFDLYYPRAPHSPRTASHQLLTRLSSVSIPRAPSFYLAVTLNLRKGKSNEAYQSIIIAIVLADRCDDEKLTYYLCVDDVMPSDSVRHDCVSLHPHFSKHHM
jgi:hypothetical protein